ncbi:hypothetical protein [Mucilaginibacter sp. UR6-11]|uniref:hypothetical protein n=1 Tax=Mucilaginibacter sp. UR6-11 TaxID=1435644 RepID=UPI001E29E278|nr:hypothetical protein [Mucilaginibacter sp. UR6-11]MCC8423831.1 hypothetical protein [Mucilaginibacter sp. UR6-11]
MKKALSLLVAVALLSSCASKKPEIKTATMVLTPPPPIAAANDGSTIEKAFKLPQVHEQEGIKAEYAILNKKYPGHKRGGQALLFHDKKPYDAIKIITSDGKEVTTYFDISNFFGKF